MKRIFFYFVSKSIFIYSFLFLMRWNGGGKKPRWRHFCVVVVGGSDFENEHPVCTLKWPLTCRFFFFPPKNLVKNVSLFFSAVCYFTPVASLSFTPNRQVLLSHNHQNL